MELKIIMLIQNHAYISARLWDITMPLHQATENSQRGAMVHQQGRITSVPIILILKVMQVITAPLLCFYLHLRRQAEGQHTTKESTVSQNTKYSIHMVKPLRICKMFSSWAHVTTAK